MQAAAATVAHPLPTLVQLCRHVCDGEHTEVCLDDQGQLGVCQQGLPTTGDAQQRRSQVPASIVDSEYGVARSGWDGQEILSHAEQLVVWMLYDRGRLVPGAAGGGGYVVL